MKIAEEKVLFLVPLTDRRRHVKAWAGAGLFPSDARISDAESTSSTTGKFGEDLETGLAAAAPSSAGRRHLMSKAAKTHTFRTLKTPSRCRECDSYVYFQGADCVECGLTSHKKCLETLALQCGHKRLPRKMNTFGVDLAQHLAETGASIPHLVTKCIDEIDGRGTNVKVRAWPGWRFCIALQGIYRVSGVKSRVEKLCQAFENGAQLVDLTEALPNVVANVLKLYLRQLPEPLLTYRLYADFVR